MSESCFIVHLYIQQGPLVFLHGHRLHIALSIEDTGKQAAFFHDKDRISAGTELDRILALLISFYFRKWLFSYSGVQTVFDLQIFKLDQWIDSNSPFDRFCGRFGNLVGVVADHWHLIPFDPSDCACDALAPRCEGLAVLKQDGGGKEQKN